MATFIKNSLLLLLITLLLSACTLFGAVKLPEVNYYVVNTVPAVAKKYHPKPVSILVAPVETSAEFNTTLMAYTTEPYKVGYFVKNRWVETPAQMLLPLMVQTLQNTHYFSRVGTSKAAGNYQYTLYTQLLHFEQVFKEHTNFVRITLSAELIRNDNNHLIAAKQFSVLEPSPEYSPYGGVMAMNRAVADILIQLAHFSERAY